MSWILILAVQFVDVTESSGLTFRHHHGGGGDKHMMETIAGGGGWFDYDGDGDLDIYLLNGAPLPGYDGPTPLTNALYRNDGGRFVDVTAEAGLSEPGYSLGFIAADIDNDGDLDAHVTSFGPNRLYRNNGDGSFSDATEAAGVGHDGFGTSAAFVDIDRDGHLDLYVANYLSYALENALYCGNKAQGIHTYCHPDNYEGAPDVLYRNEGDGTFTDISAETSVGSTDGKGLGVIATDADQNGYPDIYVANDSVMNFFFQNLGEGRLSESALASGLGFSEAGRAEAGMGVDAADFDGDGKLDIFVTNYESESNTLYRNQGGGSFLDTTYSGGLAVPSLPWVGFGTSFFDMENDGDPDIFVANGHIMDHPRFLSDATTYAQRNQLFENVAGAFRDASSEAGPAFLEERVSRGAAFGDMDEDGDVDLLVMNNDDTPNVLRNASETDNHWISFRLVGVDSNRDGIGAIMRLSSPGLSRVDEVHSGGSYLSQSDLRLHFGLGTVGHIDRVEILWPSGATQTIEDIAVDRVWVLREGSEPLSW